MDHIKIILFSLFILIMGGITLSQSGSFDRPAHRAATAEPCNAPLTYRFGDIDSRFGITESAVRDIMKEVELLWSDPLNKDIIKYDSNGEVAIHFVYSDEQEFMENEKQLSDRIERERQQYQSLKQDFQDLSNNYQEELNTFKNSQAAFNRALESYNETVSKWNAEGGVPKSEQEEIENQKEQLEQQKKELEQERRELNRLREKVNQMSERLNSMADQQNSLIYHYNERYSDKKEFNQGNYIQAGKEKKINIYQFDGIANLRLVLAHEVGHALGLDHVENPRSVMYYLMNQQDESNLQLSREDVEALRRVCGN